MAESSVTRFGPFALDRQRQVLLRGSESVGIGHRGYVLLEALVDAKGETLAKATLMERVWPGTAVEEGNLTVQIAALRKALGSEGETTIITVPRVGYRMVMTSEEGPSADTGGGRPLIAVLPFANMSSDPDQTYFADGVVEDIITALSRFKQFAVIARNSSFVYKDKAVDVRVVAKELGVRYVLEGSVRRAGDRVRVAAQLIDAETGAHVWAEKFDGAIADIFDFQDTITERVVGHIEPQIRKVEIERTRRKRPENLDAYELFQRAWPIVLGTEVPRYSEAVDLLHRAIALDPGYAPAFALAGWAHEKRLTFGTVPDGVDDRTIALELSEQALVLDRDDPAVLVMAAWNIILLGHDHDRGLALARRALELNPNHLLVLNFASLAFVACGEIEGCAEANRRALRLSPGAPDAYWTLTNLSTLALFDGKYDEAIEWGLKAVAVNGGWEATWGMLAAAYAYSDRMDEARQAVERMIEIRPDITALIIDDVHLPQHKEIIRIGLRKAGLRDPSAPH
jgi:TolB-like protein/tetratricopeptide (TPR) repeat protein